jgi:uncharacterized protein YegL
VAAAPERIDVVFALDTTGSMGGLIAGAKQKIWAIADTIRRDNPNADIRIGLVAYRDRGDAYVTEKTELTADLQAVYGRLLQVQAAGGGDWPEAVNDALQTAVARMDWARGAEACRIVFLVGDAPPHMDYPQDIAYPETLRQAARDGIVVNAVQAGNAPDTASVWRSIAQLGGGSYIPIPQTGGVVVIATPFDDEIVVIQRQLGATVVPYGSVRRQAEVAGKLKAVTAAPAPAASDMAAYSSRGTAPASRKVVTGDGDLINDIQTGRARLESVPKEDLPPDLAALTESERAAAVQTRLAERERLQGDLAKVVAKRDAYLADQRRTAKTAPDGFDEAVASLVKSQINGTRPR